MGKGVDDYYASQMQEWGRVRRGLRDAVSSASERSELWYMVSETAGVFWEKLDKGNFDNWIRAVDAVASELVNSAPPNEWSDATLRDGKSVGNLLHKILSDSAHSVHKFHPRKSQDHNWAGVVELFAVQSYRHYLLDHNLLDDYGKLKIAA